MHRFRLVRDPFAPLSTQGHDNIVDRQRVDADACGFFKRLCLDLVQHQQINVGQNLRHDFSIKGRGGISDAQAQSMRGLRGKALAQGFVLHQQKVTGRCLCQGGPDHLGGDLVIGP